MHTRLYEDWCTREDAEKNLAKIEKLVREVEARIKRMPKESNPPTRAY